MNNKVAIIGSGNYGIALSRVLGKNGVPVSMLVRSDEKLDILERNRTDANAQPTARVLGNVTLLTDLEQVLDGSNIILVTAPSKATRSVMQSIKPHYKDQVICLTAKGIEQGTGMLVPEVARDEIQSARICLLSGAGYAIDIANFTGTEVTVAGKPESTAVLKDCLHDKALGDAWLPFDEDKGKFIGRKGHDGSNFSVMESTDMIGASIYGPFKNMTAVMAGIIEGQTGKIESSVVIGAGIAQIMELIKTLGGEKETFNQSCGFPDIFLTCGLNAASRNRKFGLKVGQGESPEAVMKEIGTVEGYETLLALEDFFRRNKLPMPSIFRVLHSVLSGHERPVQNVFDAITMVNRQSK